MKIINIPQNSEEWFEARLGKITGSKLKDIISKRGGNKIGYYQLIADKLAQKRLADTSPRERGHDLEEEAIDVFTENTDIEVERDCGMWISDINPEIAISPDGAIKNEDGSYTEAVEVKCLSDARHLQAVIENKIPDDYYYQVVQYFVVCETLEKLYFVFYDPEILSQPFHVIEVTRDEVKDDIEFCINYEQQVLAEVAAHVERLAF